MSRNEFTGDEQKTKGILSKKGQENYDAIFEPKPIVRGRFKQCPETGDLLSMAEWNERYASEPRPKGPLVMVKGFDAFQSPSSGKIIRNHRELDADMKSTGCRPFEGFEQEQKEVDRYLKGEDVKLEKEVSDTVDETMYQITHNYSRPGVANKVSMTFGED